jgi:hypothetical protein
MTSGQPMGGVCAMQTVAGISDANIIKNILFTAGLSKALCRRVIFRMDNTPPTSMEAAFAEAKPALAGSPGVI